MLILKKIGGRQKNMKKFQPCKKLKVFPSKFVFSFLVPLTE